MTDLNIPTVTPVTQLLLGESIVQIMPFGTGSLACLTSLSRVLIPTGEWGEWAELPVPQLVSLSE